MPENSFKHRACNRPGFVGNRAAVTLFAARINVAKFHALDHPATGSNKASDNTVDAGVGDLVLTAHGSSGRQTDQTKESPVDAVIMAVIDHLEVGGEIVFRKS